MPFYASNQEADCEQRLKDRDDEALTVMPFHASNQEGEPHLFDDDESAKSGLPAECVGLAATADNRRHVYRR